MGQINDSGGKPINDATVKFEVISKGQPEEAYIQTVQSDKNGRFSSLILHSPYESVGLRLTISKIGYRQYIYDFTSTEAREKLEKHDEFNITLEKE